MRAKRSRSRAAVPAAACGDLDHGSRADSAREANIPAPLLREASELFKMLADPTRLRILSALASGELCVHHLSEALGMSQSAISHQLAALRAARLVEARREGKSVAYSLADDHVTALLEAGLEHAAERAAGLAGAASAVPGGRA